MGRNRKLAGREVAQHMRATEAAIWWCMIICSCGLAYPFYRHRLNQLRRTTNVYMP
jgi:hypothetical protein